jgi:1-deoxy-D-xylulose-5-phosphate reductoisomerase
MKSMSARKKLVLLGSTGSIGKQTLDVVRHFPGEFQVVALSCHRDVATLASQIAEFHPRAVAITGPLAWDGLPPGWADPAPRVYRGEEDLLGLLQEVEADLVVNALSGSRGLLPSLGALEAGRHLAIANKETLVMAGHLVAQTARKRNLEVIPVDSENFALFTLTRYVPAGKIADLVLTASGGPFLDLPVERWGDIRLEDALEHPTWKMGPKNTIDSATMANKGIELIEAHCLLGVEVEHIQVLIQPQSLVHSLVRTIDGFLYAQISQPDMRMVIQNALSHPGLLHHVYGTLDLAGKQISFLPVDLDKFRLLALAYRVARQGGPYPVVYNAANEVAFECFLNRSLPFVGIAALVEELLQANWSGKAASVEEILYTDDLARRRALEVARARQRAVS